jgi:hypothetical protein
VKDVDIEVECLENLVSGHVLEAVADEFWTLPKYSEMLFLV